MFFNPINILKEYLSKFGCKGALLALSENGATKTYSAGTIPVADHHKPYYIYSITKSFTAVAIMKLCEDHGDFLDQRLHSYFPGKTIPAGITIRQLLNHTSGLSDYFTSIEYQQAIKDHPETPWSYDKLMLEGLKATPLFPPGKGWAYSNTGYAILKECIELKSEMNYYDYLTKVIIHKAGLANTKPFLHPDTKLELLEAEAPSFSGDFRSMYHPDWITTGCLISTVSDIAKFYDSLFNHQIINGKSVTEMLQTVDVLSSSPKVSIPSYGLGLMHHRKSPLGKAYGHGGGGPGYTTYAQHYPDLQGNRVSISLVLNKSLPQTPFDLADDLIRHYLET